MPTPIPFGLQAVRSAHVSSSGKVFAATSVFKPTDRGVKCVSWTPGEPFPRDYSPSAYGALERHAVEFARATLAGEPTVDAPRGVDRRRAA